MLKYDKVQESDLHEMARLFRKYLNDGEGVEEYLKQGFFMPGFIGLTCKDGEQDDKMLGVITARPGVSFTYPHPEIEEMVKKGWPDKRIYTGDMVTVLPECRNRGISRELHIRWAEAMREAGGEYVMLELWKKHDGDVPASGTTKYLGTVEESWLFSDFYKDLYAHGMTCADCEPGPCTCGAVVMMIKL